MSSSLEINDLDQRIWEEELEGFVPDRVYDVHTHVYRWAFHTDPNKEHGPYQLLFGNQFREASAAFLDFVDGRLMPGRTVHRLAFPFPFDNGCDFAASNEFLAEQVRGRSPSAGLMLVNPAMSEEQLERAIEHGGFAGFKPYRFYSSTGDAVECRITDFLPEHQIAVADRHGLLIMMHLARREGIGDDVNLADLERLTARYPNVKWILAHCARSYAAWPLERAGERLADLPNTWFDTSSVCEADAIEALIGIAGLDRVMYGSDDVPVGVLRGKYISFGRGWAYLSETNHSMNLSHCDGRMTFTRYEQLRAMRRAAVRQGLSVADIKMLFHDTALRLVESAFGRCVIGRAFPS